MTKPNRATPGGRNRRILANGRSSGRPATRWPGWNVRRTARIVPVSAAGPASARGCPASSGSPAVGPGTGSRRRGGWPPAGVSASRQPRCRLRDCPVWAGRATWWQLVIPGRQSQRWTTAWPPRPARGTGPRRRDRDAVVLAGAWCRIPLAKVLQNPDWGPQRADSHHLQPAGPEPAAAAGRSQSRGGGTGPGGHAALAARGTGEGCGDGRGPPACGPHRACHEMLRADRPIRFSPGCGAGPAGPGGLRGVRRRLAAVQRPAMPSAACGIGSNARPAVTALVPGDRRLAGLMASAHAA